MWHAHTPKMGAIISVPYQRYALCAWHCVVIGIINWQPRFGYSILNYTHNYFAVKIHPQLQQRSCRTCNLLNTITTSIRHVTKIHTSTLTKLDQSHDCCKQMQCTKMSASFDTLCSFTHIPIRTALWSSTINTAHSTSGTARVIAIANVHVLTTEMIEWTCTSVRAGNI